MGTRRWGTWGEQGCGFASPHKQRLWEGRVRKAWDHQLQMGQNNGMGKQPKKKKKKKQPNENACEGCGELVLVARDQAGSCAFISAVTCFTFTWVTKKDKNAIVKRLEYLHPWRSSESIWMWSWADCPGWPCLSMGLDQMASHGPFTLQPFCDKLILWSEICYLTPSITLCVGYNCPTAKAANPRRDHPCPMPGAAAVAGAAGSRAVWPGAAETCRPAWPGGCEATGRIRTQKGWLTCMPKTKPEVSKRHSSIAPVSPPTFLHHHRPNRP